MPVRDSTKWRHAILEKKVINLDRGGTYVLCGWDTCEKPGLESNKCRELISAPGYPPQYLSYVFCTERHRQYFIHSVVRANDLPAGYKRSIILGRSSPA
jgi:hypothetical protein